MKLKGTDTGTGTVAFNVALIVPVIPEKVQLLIVNVAPAGN